MRKLKSQVAKVSTVRVEKILALAVQHSHRNIRKVLLFIVHVVVLLARSAALA